MSNVAFIGEISTDQHSNENDSQLKTYYDSKNKIGWYLMKGAPRPSYTSRLLSDIGGFYRTVKQEMVETNGEK